MRGADVLHNFESIGDSCEFGFVQEHFGLRPISLLRWAGCSLEGLVRALQANFAGLFALDDLQWGGDGSVVDTKYDIYYHSDLRFEDKALVRDAANLARHKKLLRDTRFRLRMFNEMLDEQQKVLVFRTARSLGIAEILRLKSALDLHGPQKLLCVTIASASHPAGVVRSLASGVKLAALASLAAGPRQDDVDAPAWLDVCAQAAISDWGQGEAFYQAPTPAAGGHVAGKADARGTAIALAAALSRTLLLREPDAVGLAQAAGVALRQGLVMEPIIASFLYSQEFLANREAFLAHYSDQAWPRMLRHVFSTVDQPA